MRNPVTCGIHNISTRSENRSRLRDGQYVGAPVGIGVIPVGVLDGRDVGASVGKRVGHKVGALVGTFDNP